MPRFPFDPATDYYQLLGVRPGASNEEIRAAYRRLAKAYHPDLNAGSPVAVARMARVNAAKSVLLDSQTRARYDQLRAARATAARVTVGHAARPAAPRVQPVSYRPQVSPQTAYRVATMRAARRGRIDRPTSILLLISMPLMAAIVLYVVQAIQLSTEPLPNTPSDLILEPNARPTTHGTADAVFLMVHTQPPNRQLARQAINLIMSRSDRTPETELLRADGRRLLQAASTGDQAGWDEAVNDLCLLAGRCTARPASSQ